MVIKSSNIAMASTRTYRMARADYVAYSGWGKGTADTTLPTAKDSVQQSVTKESKSTASLSFSQKELLSKLESEQKNIESKRANAAKGKSSYEGKVSNQIEFDTFRNILELLFGVGRVRSNWYSQLMERMEQRISGSGSSQTAVSENILIQSNNFGLSPTQSFGGHYQEVHYFEEQENTSFYSSGKVTTADGREIEFDVSAYMSRTFMEYSNLEIDYGRAATVDPLVINLGNNVADVSEQTFLFDIDCDGTLDNISMLGQLSGFLALDKNRDGIINDGSELFGAKTGNGFEELAVFDMDGNGFIDENDEIFNHLRIWTKDADGNDKLIGLGVAGIGAIYLGNVATNFSINSETTNETLAQVRSSGIYLRENGEVGSVQQVDMAIREKPAS